MSERGTRPAVLIVLEIEAAPRVWISAASDTEELRVRDWLKSQSELADLVETAIDLAEEARAA
jgi:hypothetical protein